MRSVTMSLMWCRCALCRLPVSSALAAAAILPIHPAYAADAASRAQMAPDAVVQSVSSEVLESIRADPALRAGDIDRLQKVIGETVDVYLDFEQMARLSVGQDSWRSASAEQQQALTRQIRTLLLRTYGGALSQVAEHQVKVRAFRAQPGDTEVTVRTQVTESDADPIQLDYRLERTDAGWKICDVIILGVSLIENFRSSFAREIHQNGIDGLVKALSDRNKRLAASSGKS
jgi:phospholipid transport system substrate-binding protein